LPPHLDRPLSRHGLALSAALCIFLFGLALWTVTSASTWLTSSHAIGAVLTCTGLLALACTLLIARDLRHGTRLRTALAELAERERQLDSVVSSAPILLTELDAHGVYTLVRGRGLESLGLRPEELLGRSAFEVYADHPELPGIYRRALAGEAITAQIEVGGGHLLCLKSPRRDAVGKVVGLVSVSTDVSELVRARAALQRAEEARLHAQKFEAVSRISSVVAHEFANLLTIIRGMTELLQLELGSGHAAQKDLVGIQQACQRATRLSQELLDFSRPQPHEPRVIDLSGFVRRLQAWLAALLRPTTQLVLELDERALPVRLDPGRLEQVLLNLARNADDAIPSGGTLTLCTRFAPGPGGPVGRLLVRDTGHGLSSEVRAHLFEPFFTTKEHGTGLGLSVSQGIVVQSGGTLTVESEPGHGTTFELAFPLCSEASIELKPHPARPDRHPDSEVLGLLERHESKHPRS